MKVTAAKDYLGGLRLPVVEVHVMVHSEADCTEYLMC
jgi:hypothetical protein